MRRKWMNEFIEDNADLNEGVTDNFQEEATLNFCWKDGREVDFWKAITEIHSNWHMVTFASKHDNYLEWILTPLGFTQNLVVSL